MSGPIALPLYIERRGNGPEAIVFLHGGFATGRWWHPAVDLLPPDLCTAYLVDLRGCGNSPRAGSVAGYQVELQRNDVAGALDGLGLAGFHLVGHSLGAAVALDFAVTAQHRLRSLTLVSTPAPEGTPTPPEGYELLAQMREDRDLLAQALASTMPARAPDSFFQQLVEDARQQAPVAFTATAQALADWRMPLPASCRAASAGAADVGRPRPVCGPFGPEPAAAVDPRRQQSGGLSRLRAQSDAGAAGWLCCGTAGLHRPGFRGFSALRASVEP